MPGVSNMLMASMASRWTPGSWYLRGKRGGAIGEEDAQQENTEDVILIFGATS